jgi:teichuronic acid biosynthesis glycosyltransferase TuaG
MPVFNSAMYIEDAVRSVQQQNLDDWELLVIDGCSTDDTCQIISRMQDRDPRIRLIVNQNDTGPAHARSTGIREAQGEDVAFLDGDDLWISSKLNDQIAFMRRSNSDFSYTQYRVMNNEGTQASQALTMRRKFGFWSALGFRGIATPTVIARRALFTEEILKTIGLPQGEDYIWWLLILRKGISASGLMKPLSLYRNSENSNSKNRIKHLKCVWQSYRILLGINVAVAVAVFISYTMDVIIRRFRYKLLTKIFGTLKVSELMA